MASIFSRVIFPLYKEKGFEGIANIPQIKRIKESKLVRKMALTQEKVITDILSLKFDITPSERIANLRRFLMKEGLAKKGNFVGTPISSESIQTIGFFGNRLMLTLSLQNGEKEE